MVVKQILDRGAAQKAAQPSVNDFPRTGCQWRYLPKDFPPKSTVWRYFDEWRKNSALDLIHDALRTKIRAAEKPYSHCFPDLSVA